MGFRIYRTARLLFENTAYQGAEVVVRLNVPLEFFLQFAGLEDQTAIIKLMPQFPEVVIDKWNLTDGDDNPLPITQEGWDSLPPILKALIVQHWVEAVATPPAPLGQPSPNGSTSEEPMTETATM